MLLLGHGLRVDSHRSVERFAQDVGMTAVPTRLGKQVDEDVEQGHLGVLPPAHATGGVQGEIAHSRVAVVPHSAVAATHGLTPLRRRSVLRFRWSELGSVRPAGQWVSRPRLIHPMQGAD